MPGDVYTDLWRAGEIDDPHYGRNALRAKWAMEKEWWYRRRFAVAPEWKGKVVRLVFDGVDYSCNVWVNGKYLGQHEGMFSPFEFDVSSVLNYNGDSRANELVVRLDPPPRIYRNVAGRKFAWQGDYWRTITPMGIWKPVRLVATGRLRIADVHPRSQINGDGSADIDVQMAIANHSSGRSERARVRTVIRGKNFQAGPYESQAEVSVTVDTFETTISVPTDTRLGIMLIVSSWSFLSIRMFVPIDARLWNPVI